MAGAISFQASVINTYDADQDSLILTDKSNYATTTQVDTHAQEDFDQDSFVELKVTKPDNSTLIYSNQNTADVRITTPSKIIPTIGYKLEDADPAGDYTATLTVVPSWNDTDPTARYDASGLDVVYHDDQFWKATQDNLVGSEPSASNTDWDLVSKDDVGDKYQVDVKASVSRTPVGTGSFKSTFYDTAGSYGISVTSGCGSIEITDNSNYLNGEAGHAQSDYSDYRFIMIKKPNGSLYYMSSIDFEDLTEDQTILPASSGTNSFYLPLDHSLDKDGVYEVTMCNYPTWNSSAAYTNNNLTVVFYDGNLYKLLQASTNNLPDEANSVYWELYELTDPEDEYDTRYCTCGKIAVLCISTYDCLEKLLHAAYCKVDSDYCNDDLLCGNKALLDYVKLKVLVDSIGKAMRNSAWAEAKNMFNMVYNICGCC
jgi:hypothetical protein